MGVASLSGSIYVPNPDPSDLVSIYTPGVVSTHTTLQAIADLALNPAGTTYFVNETIGNDSNPGTPSQPFATLAAGLAACAANSNDQVAFWGTIHISATLAWNKAGVNLIGLNAPSGNTRARISQTGSSVFSPLVNVTGAGCMFSNFATFHGFADASTQVCWVENGGRNGYFGVQFYGMGNATAAAQAGSRSLLVQGSDGENLFVGCTIGLDTVIRATNANASLEFTGASPRNEFHGCTFRALVTDVSDTHVTVGSGGIDRYALFKNCTFLNAINSGGSSMNVAFLVNASAGGSVLLDSCASVGAAVYATTGPIYVMGPVPTGNTSGLAVAAT